MGISHKDIEQKLREIEEQVDDASTVAKPAGVALGTLFSASAIGIAYTWGQRKARKQTTVVEIRRE